ncbi:hypothetical protein C9374_011536 [Naegleria lovaniensis]|uniref:Uncharacterized protein n=1 Tax=Naegleria lovaniensis TaxID=51637 RepID=A0AA88KQW0_NAELO|nr:uncharacterized protein C9374_011536 [Naegleria lovaniensis]KAG2392811.1 hypothetical protein C9374_011536 [Naegleria lovaniensis]
MTQSLLLPQRPVLAQEEDYMKKVAQIVGSVDRSQSKAGSSSATFLAGSRKELYIHFDENEKKIADRQMRSAQLCRRAKQKEALENTIEKKVKRPQTAYTSSFKAIERDHAPIYRKDENIQTTPGQYDVNYSLIDKKELVLKWVPHHETPPTIDENYKYYLEGEKLSTNDGKGTSYQFKSKTVRSHGSHKNGFSYENEFLETGPQKDYTKFKEDRSTIRFDKSLDRNKASELYVNKTKPTIGDLVYETVDPNVYSPTISRGIVDFGLSSDRKTARKGSRMNTELVKTDIENNPQISMPNWNILQHSNPEDTLKLSTVPGNERQTFERVVSFEKQVSREETPPYKRMLWTPSAYYNQLNASEYQKKRDAEQEVERFKKDKKNAGESMGLNSEMNAYSKTHPNIPFMCYIDKQLDRQKLATKPPLGNDLDYHVQSNASSKYERVRNISCMPKPKKKNSSNQPLESQKIDENYKFYTSPEDWSKSTHSHNFGTDTSREKCKAPIEMRYSKENIDIFYDASRTLVEQRIKGDPLIRCQLPRDNNKTKLFKAQHNFQLDPNEVLEKVKPGQNLKKGFVDMARARRRKDMANHNDFPSVGSYKPKYSIVESKPISFTIPKSGV